MDAMLAAEVALLAYDDETGRPLVNATRLDAALTAAVVVDQILTGTLAIEDSAEKRKERRFVATAMPVSDPLLAEIVAKLDGQPLKKGIQRVYTKYEGKIRTAVLDSLVASGDLATREKKVLGIFPRTDHPAANSSREADARARLTAALDGPLPPDQRTAVLLGIIAAADLVHEVLPGRDKKATKARIKELTDGDWAGESTKAIIDAAEAATAAAVSIVVASVVVNN